MTRDVVVLVPCKRLDRAKTRLAGRLSAPVRARLAEYMLRDVLVAVQQCTHVGRTVLLSDDPRIALIGKRHRISCLADAPAGGLCQSILQATQTLSTDGLPNILILPGDIPTVTPTEIDTLITRAPDRGIAVVPDQHGTGTNALLGRPLVAMSLHFGPSSFVRHIHTARRRGLEVVDLSLEGISFDIDVPDDLERLQVTSTGPYTRQVLAEIATQVHTGDMH